jgi:hypothetical protein
MRQLSARSQQAFPVQVLQLQLQLAFPTQVQMLAQLAFPTQVQVLVQLAFPTQV